MKFEHDRGGARAAWPDQDLEMGFELMRLDRRTGEVTAELTATAGSNGSAELLHRTRLNLLSTRSREEVVRRLQQRRPGPDWALLMEAACWKVIEAQRRGRPAVLLRDVTEPPAAGWLIPPILSAADPAILFGDGGRGKSYLALALAASVHSGRALAGLEVRQPIRIAYLDWEWSEWPHYRRLRALWGPGELPDFLYVPCAAEGPLSHQVDRLRRILSQHQVGYVVIDSVALACDGPPEEAQSALGFFQALAQLEAGALLVGHVNRQGDTEKPFGSAFWHNSARSTWYVDRVQEVEGTSFDLGLYQKKHNDGAPAAPIGLRFDFTGDLTTIRRIDLLEVPELAPGLPLKARIQHELAGGPLKVYELAELLDAKPDSVDRTLRRYGWLFERSTEAADKVTRWANRTTVRGQTGQLSAGQLATEADTLSPSIRGDAVRPQERPEQEELKVSGLPGGQL